MFKKAYTMLLAFVLLLTVILTGCSGNSEEASGESGSKKNDKIHAPLAAGKLQTAKT
ncbi:hypothetical protein GCM10020331_080080 [Ectobacillus funiculus]